jgi:hypothetical protein
VTRIEKIIVVVLGLISVSLLGFIIRSWTSQGSPAPGAAAAAANSDAEIRAMTRSAIAIRANLTDPDSARAKDIEVFQTTNDGKMITICGKVNAKNKFGGYVGFKAFIYREAYAEPYQVIIAEDDSSNRDAFIKKECLKDKLEAEKKMK